MGCPRLGPRVWAVAALGLWLGACASTTTSQIASLTAEGRANPLRAHAAHRKEQVRVEALVVSTGLKNVDTIKGNTDAVSADMGPVTLTSGGFTARKGATRFPYLIARDPNSSQAEGELLCFFDPEDIDQVATLDPGSRITLQGRFQEYSKGGARVVLNMCEIE
jgi:hypothetical protein